MTTQIVILAAGMGSRLGRSLPKPLTELERRPHHHAAAVRQHPPRVRRRRQGDDRRRLQARAHHRGVPAGVLRLQRAVRPDEHLEEPHARPAGVAGGRRALDERRRRLRPARSSTAPLPFIARDQSFVTVNTAKVSDEEVKYTTDAEGYINELSKTVEGGLGEAVGINYVVEPRQGRAPRASSRASATRTTSSAASSSRSSRTACSSSRSTSPTSTRSRSTSPKTWSARTSSSESSAIAAPGDDITPRRRRCVTPARRGVPATDRAVSSPA